MRALQPAHLIGFAQARNKRRSLEANQAVAGAAQRDTKGWARTLICCEKFATRPGAGDVRRKEAA
jgi:hypothetical protein